MLYQNGPKEKDVRFHKYRVKNKWNRSDQDIWPWLMNQSSGLYVTFRRIIKALQKKYGNADLKFVPDLFGSSTKTIIKEVPVSLQFLRKSSQDFYNKLGVNTRPVVGGQPNPAQTANHNRLNSSSKPQLNNTLKPQAQPSPSNSKTLDDNNTKVKKKADISSSFADMFKNQNNDKSKTKHKSNNGLLSNSELKGIINPKH